MHSQHAIAHHKILSLCLNRHHGYCSMCDKNTVIENHPKDILRDENHLTE